MVPATGLLFCATMSTNGAPRREPNTVRAAALEGYVPLLAELGHDGRRLVVNAGIDPHALDQPDRFIAYPAFLQALHFARIATGVERFGLLLADRQPLSMFGALGLAMASAPNVRTVIEDLNTFYHVHTTGSVTSLTVQGGLAMWRFEVIQPGMVGVREQEDLAAGIGHNILRRMLGADWSPELVSLQRPKPAEPGHYRAKFGSRVEFEAEYNQTVFDADLLNTPLPQSNVLLHDILNSHLKSLSEVHLKDDSAEVQMAILRLMKSGPCGLRQVAAMLGTSERTLQRRLRRSGSMFQEELDTVRSRVALRFLEESSISMTNLALILGYSDLSVFSHAFKRKMGQSPSAWRRNFA